MQFCVTEYKKGDTKHFLLSRADKALYISKEESESLLESVREFKNNIKRICGTTKRIFLFSNRAKSIMWLANKLIR